MTSSSQCFAVLRREIPASHASDAQAPATLPLFSRSGGNYTGAGVAIEQGSEFAVSISEDLIQ
jgi:hypothetical protein